MFAAASVTAGMPTAVRVPAAKTLSASEAFTTSETLSTTETSTTPETPSTPLESFGCMAAASQVKAAGAVAAYTRWCVTPTKEMGTAGALRFSLGPRKVLASERISVRETSGRLSCKLAALET